MRPPPRARTATHEPAGPAGPKENTMGYELRDANLKVTKTLPNGAAAVNSDKIDLGSGLGDADFLADVELLLSAPALTTAQLGDAATMTYDVQTDDDANFGSPLTLIDNAIVQTGAAGAGAAAATKRFRLPSNVERYIRVVATNSAAGNASTVSLALEVLA